MSKNTNRISLIIVILSIIIVIIFMILMYCDGYTIGIPIAMEETGQFGDYFGGVVGTIFSGAAFWLLYLTLKQQREQEIKTDFNSQFSQMLLINQQNIQSMVFDASKLLTNLDKLYIEPRIYSGKDVFQIVFYQFVTCRNELMPILSKTSKIYTKEYEDYICNLPIVKKRNFNIYQLAQIDIVYSIVFFGVGSEGIRILKSLFKDRYKDTIIDKILKFISLKPAFDKSVNKKWIQLESFTSPRNILQHVYDIYDWRENHTHIGYAPKYPSISDGFRSNYVKYYNGFHQVLGHYFRHNYQLIKFIDTADTMSIMKKYSFAKIVRGQMSNYEQIVFFLNSLSFMGRSWEIEPEQLNKSSENSHLITHYKLIKNIPYEMLFGIPVKEFYPDIDYEIFK